LDKYPEYETPICSTNGCEIVNSFLESNTSEQEIEDLEKEIIKNEHALEIFRPIVTELINTIIDLKNILKDKIKDKELEDLDEHPIEHFLNSK